VEQIANFNLIWPDGNTLIGQLPLKGEGVTRDEADEQIALWYAMLPFEPIDRKQTGKAIAIVTLGARSEMEKTQLRRAGHIQTPNADIGIERANAMMEEYAELGVDATTDDGKARISYISPKPRHYTGM
jgi:hypothetical protein